MKSITDIFGVALVILGILALSYQGYHYTKQEELAKIGDVKLTTETQKNVYFPPYLGDISMAAGILVLAIGRFKK